MPALFKMLTFSSLLIVVVLSWLKAVISLTLMTASAGSKKSDTASFSKDTVQAFLRDND